MTAKEKAIEIIIQMQFQSHPLMFEQAKRCALISVDEILFVLEFNLDFKMEKSIKYWQEVKQEIEKL